ncbi:beta-ketoacyl synthase N-terminal-like domain-containing protein [Streptomyces sp. NPDC057696]|uniref:beta-ketoacyl synthase N-terminal-like domain-containing protein n=1 Tax=Streptomyces sp. NPDC057696 TaxID=3346218 RepID=UPI0036C7F839
MTLSGVCARAEDRDIAVVGMACRLPGADSPRELWELLSAGGDATGEAPQWRGIDHRGGFVRDVADFDAEFFGMSEAEASELDPQQRLLLMTAWESLEDAGQPADGLAGSRAAVFVGASRADFLEAALRRGPEAITARQYHNVRAALPARLSYVYDLRGPSVLVDTACSSSLVALHQAVLSLRAGESPLALVAGVNLPLRSDEHALMAAAGNLAADGRSKFGSADADGHAPSDAVCVVVLKPLAAAVADGDRVRAVIAGSAVGNDGRSGDALLDASLAGQSEVLRCAYADAGIDPADVDFVEAHGPGSHQSDPVELTALGQVLGRGRAARQPLVVGSVKANIGHAEAAGGLAGLVKAVLCLEHGAVVAGPGGGAPHPDVDWDTLPVEIPDRTRPLPSGTAVAGVSSQGVSALNAHVVLRQAEPAPAPPKEATGVGPWVLPVSARSPQALQALCLAYAAYLRGEGSAHQVADICHSAAVRRSHQAHRRAVTGATHAELAAALERPAQLPQTVGSLGALYVRGDDVDWAAAYGPGGRYVPLPGHPWRTRRHWPGETTGTQQAGGLAEWIVGQHARTGFDDRSALAEIGFDSLARLQLAVEAQQRTGSEVDPEEVGRLRTVGELRAWIHRLEVAAR